MNHEDPEYVVPKLPRLPCWITDELIDDDLETYRILTGKNRKAVPNPFIHAYMYINR